MELRIEYRIIPEMNLIIEYYSGKIYYDEFIRFKIKQNNDKNYRSDFNVLVDLRDSELMLTEDQLIQIFKLVKEKKILSGKRKVAQLTSTPNHVVVTTLLERHKIIPIDTDIFSTLEASIKFLGFPNSHIKIINAYIEQIKTPPNN